MSETYVTVVGNVATQPEIKQTSAGVPVTRFRLATNERRFDRASGAWSDGPTNFYTVWAWRVLGENVCGSVGMGEPVIVQGKLRVVEREDKSQMVSIDAVTVGHDLSRGTSAFRRVFRQREGADRTPGSPGAAEEPDEFALPAPADPARSAASSEPPFGTSSAAQPRRGPASAPPSRKGKPAPAHAPAGEPREAELVPS